MGLIEIEKIKWRKIHILLAKWNTSRSKMNNSNEQDFLHIDDAHNFISTADRSRRTHTHTHIQIHDYIFLMFSHNLVAIMPTRVSENDLSSLISISSLLTTFIWLHCVLYSLIWYSQYAEFTGVQKISHWDLEPNNLFSLLYRERVFFFVYNLM